MWIQPETHGSPITEYKIMLGITEKDIAVHSTSTGESITLKNLAPATKYYTRVIVSTNVFGSLCDF